jgi:hypothetical protein
MQWDSCASGLVTSSSSCVAASPPPPLPGAPFFEDVTHLLQTNPAQRNYGVAVTDTNADGIFEFVVAGFGAANQIFQWDAQAQHFADIAPATMQDPSGQAIGVAACDIDGDGYEELYVLNTDQYSGTTSTSDRLYDRDGPGQFVELFGLPANANSANYGPRPAIELGRAWFQLFRSLGPSTPTHTHRHHKVTARIGLLC